MLKNKQVGFSPIIIILGIVLIMGVIGGAYYYLNINYGQKYCFQLNEEQCKNRSDCFPDHLPNPSPNFMCQNKSASVTKPPVACTQEAKICPDGSSVSRTGPNCEFSSCPSPLPKPTLDQTSCNTVSDCGVNTCSCKAERKEFLSKYMCARVCLGELKCLNNKCVLDRSKLSQ